MKLLGVLMAVAGWLIPVLGLTFTSSVGVRLLLCIAGIAVTLIGILGVLNKAYLQRALWKM